MNVERLIETCLNARIPVIVTGPPGTGKTGWGLMLEKKGFKVIQLIASVREPADIGGWPMRTERGLVLEPGAWAKEAAKFADEGERVVIMWDEARTINAHMQAAILKVVHENLVGDSQLPKSITHLAFANSVEDSAGGVPLEPPMANRWAHVPWVFPADKWCASMSVGEFAPQRMLDEDALSRLTIERANVAAFINKRRELLHSMPKDEEKRDGAWPSPRTWDYAAHLWAQAGPGADWSFREELLAACVGIPAAGEFIVWRESVDLLDPEDVLKGEYEKKVGAKTLKLVDPDRPDRTYAILSSTTAALMSKWTPARYEAMWKVLAFTAKEGAADVAAALVGKVLESNKGGATVNISKYVAPFADLLKRAAV